MSKKIAWCILSQRGDWDKGIVNRNYFMIEALRRKGIEIIPVWYLPYSWKSSLRALKKFYLFNDLSRFHQGFHFPFHFLYPKKTWDILQDFLGRNGLLLISHMFTTPPHDFVTPHGYDLIDDWVAHPSYQSENEFLKRKYISLQTENNCVSITSVNAEILTRYALKGVEVRNGFDAQWLDRRDLNFFKKIEKQKKAPIIVYSGTIQERFDFDLLYAITTAHLDKEFYIAGPVWSSCIHNLSRFAHMSHVHFLGRITSLQKNSLLSLASLAIIPHHLNDRFIESTDSMKLYEFSAAGLTTIMRPEGSYDSLPGIVSVNTIEEWNTALSNRDLYLLTEEARVQSIKERASALYSCTWDARAIEFIHAHSLL
jgi:glycosyltransferase involved in cell wall biosynthesis